MSPSISIRLTEPVVFLRESPETQEDRHHRNDSHPSFIRGLVTLTLVKPTRITSIEVTLEGKSATIWPDVPSSMASRRAEIPSEKVFMTAHSTLYSAKACPSSKRSASLGPFHPDEDLSRNHPSLRSRSTQPRIPHRNSSEFNRWSDSSTQEHMSFAPLDLVASPPLSPFYTPPYTPQYSTVDLPTISRPDTPVDNIDSSSTRWPPSVQEPHRSLQASPMSLDDGFSHTRHHTSGSSSLSSRITFTIPSPPISRSVSRDYTQTYDRTASPSPNPSTPRGRHSSKWSLSSMTHIFKDATERIRSVSKEPDSYRGRNPEPRQHDRGLDHEKFVGESESEPHHVDTKHLDNWKEFRKGTYTYPISFTLPINCPPTVRCVYGSVSYTLRAVVHRPGALTPRTTCFREVVVVASTAEDDTEATHSIAIERQWDTQLRYIISLGGRNFVIGGTIPFSLTLAPLDKCKIFRLSIFLEEKISHRLSKGQMLREPPVKRFELLSIKHPLKANAPILPIDPDQADVLKPYVETSSLVSSDDEAFTSFMGPGPWVLSHMLQLGADCPDIHFSFKHAAVNMVISHTLKIIFRVERGDDQAMDSITGKRRQFDIVVQMPIRILSCYSNVELTSLPRYTFFAPENDMSFNREQMSGHVTPLLQLTHHEQSPIDFLNTAVQFSRLVAGQENISGEPPPQYEVTSE